MKDESARVARTSPQLDDALARLLAMVPRTMQVEQKPYSPGCWRLLWASGSPQDHAIADHIAALEAENAELRRQVAELTGRLAERETRG
jgi:hypothetical protein